jgi:hypothetical protein
MGRHMRRDPGVQLELPVHALGDRLDHQIALGQQAQVLLVVGRLDQGRVLGHAQRRGLELLEVVDRLQSDRALGALLGRQVEQHDRHPAIDQMGGDLRTHHPGAEHGHLANLESTHRGLPNHHQNNASSIAISGATPARALRIRPAVSGSSLAK